MNEVSNNIKKLRQERKMSQEQLAEQLHVTRQAVSNWETGKTQPDIDTLDRLATVFDVSVERVIYGKAKRRLHFTVQFLPQECINMGMILAMLISYIRWESIGWAILHGALNWLYVIYYIIRY